MKFADLDTETTYAYRTSSYGHTQKLRVKDASTFYSRILTGPDKSKLVPSDKRVYKHGTYALTGVLAEVERDGTRLVNPRHIISTWAEYEAQEAREQELHARQKDLAAQRAATDAANHQEILTLAESLDLPFKPWEALPGTYYRLSRANLLHLLQHYTPEHKES